MTIYKKENKMVIAHMACPRTASRTTDGTLKKLGWGAIAAGGHLTYKELKEQYPELDDVFSFMVCRNPYQRIVSVWDFRKTPNINHFQWGTTGQSFSDFVKHVEKELSKDPFCFENQVRPQSDYWDENINRVLRFENLAEDFKLLMQELGEDPIELENIGELSPDRHANCLDCYDLTTLKIVTRLYKRDFKRFGYKRRLKLPRKKKNVKGIYNGKT
jgi:hypothetical protein